MLTKSTVNVIVVSICVSLAFSETRAELGFLCNKMHVCSEIPAKLVYDPLVLFDLVVFVTMSRLQKYRCIIFTKKVGTGKNLLIMCKELESRHFSGPNIDYIDKIMIPETKKQRRKSSERGSVEPAED